MLKFNYYKDEKSKKENYESYNDWTFEKDSIYDELLKIISKDVDRLTEGILEEYSNLSGLRSSLTNFLEEAEKYGRNINIWQSDLYLTFFVEAFDICKDKIERTLVIKDNWKDFYFITKSEVDNNTMLERYYVRKDEKDIIKEEYKRLEEFNHQDDEKIDNSIKRMLLSSNKKEEK